MAVIGYWLRAVLGLDVDAKCIVDSDDVRLIFYGVLAGGGWVLKKLRHVGLSLISIGHSPSSMISSSAPSGTSADTFCIRVIA